MNRCSPLTWLLLAWLPACHPSDPGTNPGTGGSGGTTASTTSAGSGGSGGSPTTTGIDTTPTTTDTETTTTETTTTSGTCDDPPNPPPGNTYPSDCRCAPEAAAYLPLIAMAALNRFQSAGSLCDSTIAIPAAVPMGMGYQPVPNAGMDFFTGDAQTGWLCLDFAPPGGIHCRYRYTAGGDYSAPSVGGPDAGPGGFEVTAEGDDNGDGLTSLFAIAGQLDAANGTLSLTPLFEHNPAD